MQKQQSNIDIVLNHCCNYVNEILKTLKNPFDHLLFKSKLLFLTPQVVSFKNCCYICCYCDGKTVKSCFIIDNNAAFRGTISVDYQRKDQPWALQKIDNISIDEAMTDLERWYDEYQEMIHKFEKDNYKILEPEGVLDYLRSDGVWN
ncbi:MAG: hypothetical protein Q8Q23_04095 [bacterium]|nr:hypothetical protein [bacterium]